MGWFSPDNNFGSREIKTFARLVFRASREYRYFFFTEVSIEQHFNFQFGSSKNPSGGQKASNKNWINRLTDLARRIKGAQVKQLSWWKEEKSRMGYFLKKIQIFL